MNENRRKNKDQNTMEYGEFSVFSSIKKCPKCGGELEEGYVHAARGIYWDTTRHKFWGSMGESLISLWSWAIPYAPSLRCRECNLVIFIEKSEDRFQEQLEVKCEYCGTWNSKEDKYCRKCGKAIL